MIRKGPRWTERLGQGFDRLWNYADARNILHFRYLERRLFELGATVMLGPVSVSFTPNAASFRLRLRDGGRPQPRLAVRIAVERGHGSLPDTSSSRTAPGRVTSSAIVSGTGSSPAASVRASRLRNARP